MDRASPFYNLYDWFQKNKRNFPWREKITPYHVWVSEVMLQQTRASVVVPYYQRWMELFPSVEALAKADLTEVIKAWEGLGYYQRARNLHIGAQEIVANYSGRLPEDEALLRTIRGMGPYTVRAIRAFAFGHKDIAIDGNVKRVLSRFFLIEDEISSSLAVKKLERYAAEIAHSFSSSLAEAFIELGATICQKKPLCSLCPISFECKAYAADSQERLPIKKKKEPLIGVLRGVYIVHSERGILTQRQTTGLMKDLYEFPYMDFPHKPNAGSFMDQNGIEANEIKELPMFSQTYTKYRVRLTPFYIYCKTSYDHLPFEWTATKDIMKYPFSSGHRKILNWMNEEMDEYFTS